MRAVAIFGDDFAYNRSLAAFINRNRASEFLVVAFNSLSDLSVWAKENDGFLLFVDEARVSEAKNAGFIADFILTEKKDSGEGYIFKYQSMDSIIKLLPTEERVVVEQKNSGEFKIVTVIDPAFIFGASAECLRLATEKVAGGEHVLIVSFNPYFQAEAENGFRAGLSELIYSLKLRGRGWLADGERIINSIQMVDCINGLRNPFELSYFDEDMAKEFLKSIASGDKYSLLIVDGGYLPRGIEYFLKVSDEIKILDNEDKSVIENLIWQLKNHFGEAILEKVREICAEEVLQEVVSKKNLSFFKGKR